MKAFIKSVVDLILYSSLHISIGAALLAWETFVICGIPTDWNYVLLIFYATMLIYSLHRIIGIQLVESSDDNERFRIIRKFRSHLIIYAVLAFIGCGYSVLNIDPQYHYYFLIPAAISLLYVIPFFGGQRLRDMNYIKLILIAMVWAYVCSAIPILKDGPTEAKDVLWILEKFFFIVAITIPFDVRDIEVDRRSGVETIATRLGQRRSYHLSFLILLIGFIMLMTSVYHYKLGVNIWLMASVIYILTGIAIYLSRNKKSDYYFSGLLDGTIILRSSVLILCLIL